MLQAYDDTRSPRMRRAYRVLLPWFCLACAAALTMAVSPALSVPAVDRFVESVEAQSSVDDLEVKVVTSETESPWFSIFPLREPHRLVMDIPDHLWKPGLTAHLATAHPEVQEVRVGQFSEEPPITRIVLDLETAAEEFQYRAMSATDGGGLRLLVAEELGPNPVATASTSPPAAQKPTPPAAAPKVKISHVEAETTEPQRPKPVAARSEPEAQPEETAAASLAASGPDVFDETAADVGSSPGPDETSPHQTPPPAAMGVRQEVAGGGDGHLWRVLGAAVVLIATGIIAFWARRRLASKTESFMGEAIESPLMASPDSPLDETTDGTERVIKCKVVDGYLVLAPEEEVGALGGLGQSQAARVSGNVDLSLEDVDDRPMQPVEPPASAPQVDVEDLLSSLGDENIMVRKSAAQSLWELAAAGRTEVLLPHLQSQDPMARSVIAGVLGEAGAVDCIDELVKLAEDEDPSVRASVLYAFAQLGEAAAEHADLVRTHVSDSESAVRAVAVEALAAMFPKSKDVAQQVVALTSESDPTVRQAAVDAGFAYARRGIAQPLIDLIGDLSRRAQALEILQQADEAVLRRLLIVARGDSSERGRVAMDALSYVMSRRWTAEDFKGELSSDNPEIRLAGVDGLAMVGTPEAQQVLARLVKNDPAPKVRDRAAEILSGWEKWSGETAAAWTDSSSEDA